MAWQERTISVDRLELGMYVCRLDRDWKDSPFHLQGFLLESEAQLADLKALCREVTIDVAQTRADVATRIIATTVQRATVAPTQNDELKSLKGHRNYSDLVRFHEELPKAKLAHDQLSAFSIRALNDVRAGRRLHVDEINQAVVPVVESVLRSADAVFWLNALRERSSYEYSHALNCTVLAVAFGRHLGFPEDMLVHLAVGGLLLDVGKAQLSDGLLMQIGPLTEAQVIEVRRHVDYSLAIVAASGNRSPEVEAMAGAHHERIDGSGYPHGLQGTEIPLFGRVAAIIDSFDAMSSDKPYRRGIARHEATGQLYRARNSLFQAELVEQFTQCIGAFPTGSLVELSTGEVAIVMAQNRSRALCPRVMVLTTADKQVRQNFREIDLTTVADLPNPDRRVRVLRALDPGSYGLDPTELYL